jgi:hypothetical protein
LVFKQSEEPSKSLKKMSEHKFGVDVGQNLGGQLVHNLLVFHVCQGVVRVVIPFVLKEGLNVILKLLIHWVVLIKLGQQREKAVEIVSILNFRVK